MRESDIQHDSPRLLATKSGGREAHSDHPLVSIGVPVYNRADLLPRCLDALQAQTYPNIEICISDNASIDGSAEICRRIAATDWRVRLNENLRNLGLMTNFRIVEAMSRGEYFMWAGSDDLWHPEFVSVLVEELTAHPTAAAAMTATDRVYMDGEKLDRIRYVGRSDPNEMTPLQQARNLMTISTAVRRQKLSLYTCGLFRAEILDQALEDNPSEGYPGDRPLLTIIALSGGLRYVDQPLFTKTLHRRSFSERNPNDAFTLRKIKRGASLAQTMMVARWIARSTTVPPRRKLCIPIIVGPRLIRWAYDRAVAHSPTTLRRLAKRVLVKCRLIAT